MLFMLIEVI